MQYVQKIAFLSISHFSVCDRRREKKRSFGFSESAIFFAKPGVDCRVNRNASEYILIKEQIDINMFLQKSLIIDERIKKHLVPETLLYIFILFFTCQRMPKVRLDYLVLNKKIVYNSIRLDLTPLDNYNDSKF